MLSFREDELKLALFNDIDSSIVDILLVLPALTGTDIGLAADLLDVAKSYSDLERGERVSIACDPRVVSTVRHIGALLACWDGSSLHPEIHDGLIMQMRRIGLACALKRRMTFAFVEKFIASPSFCIPGTSTYLQYEGCRGHYPLIQLRDGLIEGDDYRAVDLALPGHSLALALPEFALQPPWTQERLLPENIVRQQWPSPMEEAANLLSLDRSSYELVRTYGPLIVAIENENPSIMSSVSFDSHPGAIFTSWCDRIEMFAEILVHESDHQRHYLFAHLHPIWLDGEGTQPALFRSPWRDDPRPIDGILRGASAFVSVGSFWEKILEHCDLQGASDRREWVLSRAVYTNYQAIDALQTVRRATREFSSVGQDLIEFLSLQARLTRDSLVSLRDSYRFLKRAEETQKRHDIAWEIRNTALSRNSNRQNAEKYLQF